MFAKNAEDLLFNDDVVDSLKAKIVYIYTDGSGYIDPDEAVVELIRSNIEQQIISKDDLVSLIAESIPTNVFRLYNAHRILTVENECWIYNPEFVVLQKKTSAHLLRLAHEGMLNTKEKIELSLQI